MKSFITFIKENLDKPDDNHLYHVTHTKHVEHIKKDGIKPLQTSNWVKAGDKKRYGDGSIFACKDHEEAVRTASHMDWHFNNGIGTGKVSIVKFKKSNKDKWEKDDNDPLSNRGKWVKQKHMVKPENIVSHEVLTPEHARKLIKGN